MKYDKFVAKGIDIFGLSSRNLQKVAKLWKKLTQFGYPAYCQLVFVENYKTYKMFFIHLWTQNIETKCACLD
jgi:hypothetical protein